MGKSEYHHLYNTKAWRDLRIRTFIRDGYRCQNCGDPVRETVNEPKSAIGHHREPHHGDLALFFDPDNVETSCKACHDGHHQSMEKGGQGKPTYGEDGWPIKPITLH